MIFFKVYLIQQLIHIIKPDQKLFLFMLIKCNVRSDVGQYKELSMMSYYKMNLDRTVKWIDKTEGRDKFCKAIQYACRILKHRFEIIDTKESKETSLKFKALFQNMRDARKLFRLLKSVNEIKKMKDLFEQEMTIDNALNIIVRGFFALYWLFDNLNILSKIKVLNGPDPKTMGKTASTFWLLALLTNLALLLFNLWGNVKKVGELKKKYYSSSSESQTKQRKKEFASAMSKRETIYLNLVKVIGDIIPACQGSELLIRFFKINDTWCGLGGLFAAIITSYQLYD